MMSVFLHRVIVLLKCLYREGILFHSQPSVKSYGNKRVTDWTLWFCFLFLVMHEHGGWKNVFFILARGSTIVIPFLIHTIVGEATALVPRPIVVVSFTIMKSMRVIVLMFARADVVHVTYMGVHHERCMINEVMTTTSSVIMSSPWYD